MKTKFVSVKIVKDVIAEKIEFYKVWLDRGVIDNKEFTDCCRTLNTLETGLAFRALDLKHLNTQEKFIVSDYCGDCNGDGISVDDGGQCETCEELHQQELRADRMQDEEMEAV